MKIGKMIDDRLTGWLAFLLVILGLNFMKAMPTPSARWGSLCDRPLFVQVEGDVPYPGVYELCKRDRLEDALVRAMGQDRHGSVPEGLDAISLHSGVGIVVLSTGTGRIFSEKEMSAFHKMTLGIPISLNRESPDGLTAIPGIGPVLAGRIVNERSKREGFKHLEEILGVSGIGPELYGKIRAYGTL